MELGRLNDCPGPACEEFWGNIYELIFRKD